MRFVDEVEITCISGKGGDGASSFLREKHRPHGGPDGGDGGRGGSVILRADPGRTTLEHLRGRRVYKAKSGGPGRGRHMHGRGADDYVIEVPVGTVVLDRETGAQLADLTEPDAFAVVVRGGGGGRGNMHFKTAGNRTPRKFEPGEPASTIELALELKLLADVGLVGFPNAGKSTLISVISNARPKVADYPFTTLVPNLGVVSRGWEGAFVVADIPGLVEGASEGVGLGHQFLRHVERCRVLVHLVAASGYGEPVEDPVERYQSLRGELSRFSPELSERPELVVVSKIDVATEHEVEDAVARFTELLGAPPLLLSSLRGDGTKALTERCWALVQERDDG